MDLIFNESRDKIVKALELVESNDSITKSPPSYINQYFDQNKQNIQARRYKLVTDINKYSDQLIEENEANRKYCLQLSVQTKEIDKLIDIRKKVFFLKEELKQVKQQFDKFDSKVTQSSCETAVNIANYLKDRMNRILKDFRESLLLNKELSFIFFDRPIEQIVGIVVDKKQIEPIDEEQVEVVPYIPSLSSISNDGFLYNIQSKKEIKHCNAKCIDCKRTCLFRLSDLNIDMLIKLTEINAELKRHGHPASRITGRKPNNRWNNRSLKEAKSELKKHYIECHNLK